MKKIIVLGLLVLMILVVGCSTNQSTTQTAPTLSETMKQVTLSFEGMTCPSCALGVEYQLKQLPGVSDAKISYEEGRGIITYDASILSPEEIAEASTEYPATIIK